MLKPQQIAVVQNLPAHAQKRIAVQTANALVAVDAALKTTAVARMANAIQSVIARSSS